MSTPKRKPADPAREALLAHYDRDPEAFAKRLYHYMRNEENPDPVDGGFFLVAQLAAEQAGERLLSRNIKYARSQCYGFEENQRLLKEVLEEARAAGDGEFPTDAHAAFYLGHTLLVREEARAIPNRSCLREALRWFEYVTAWRASQPQDDPYNHLKDAAVYAGRIRCALAVHPAAQRRAALHPSNEAAAKA